MARGKRTDPLAAVLAKVMAEMGFETGLISEVAKLPKTTVTDITGGNGRWREMPQKELFEITRLRVRVAIERVADDLAMQAITRLEEKIKRASLIETCSILNALSRIGG